MTASKSLVTQNGVTRHIPDADSLLVGTGIDRNTAGDLTIGGSTATSITLGSATTPVSIPGDVNTVGGTTFTSDATFEGAVTFGNGDASDTVSFNAATTITSDMNFGGSAEFKLTNMADPASDQDAATKAYADTKLSLAGGVMLGEIDMGSLQINNLADGTLATDAATVGQVSAVSDFQYEEEIFVSKNGSDSTGTGAVLNPFASVTAAMAAITDATPTKRYAIRVEAGAYTEAGVLSVKPNVFVVGVSPDSTRVTATSFDLDASFTGSADNRSGFSDIATIGAHDYDFAAATSTAGKLYFRNVVVTWSSSPTQAEFTISGTNAINQAIIDNCTFFSTLTFSGVNIGAFSNNKCYSSIVMNQHSSVPTILNASGGFADSLTATAAVSDFNRRCSVFSRGLKFDGTVTVDGPSAYFDYTVGSLPNNGATVVNGGNLVSADFGANKELSNLVFPTAVNNPIMPASSSATNLGDWGKQWFFNFNYVNASSGTDLYIGSVDSVYDAAGSSAGYGVYLQPDQYGLQADVDGGLLDMRTSSSSGTGTSGNVDIATGDSADGDSGDITITTGTPSGAGARGLISLDGAEVDVNSTKIVNLADGVNPNDAVNKSQLDAIVSGVSDVSATAPLLSSGGATPDISFPSWPADASGSLTNDGSGNLSWVADAGGTVTSVDVSGGTTGLTTSGGPITGSGTITLDGTLNVANGGTGATSLTSGSLLAGNGTSAVAEIAPGTEGDVLTVVGGAWVSQAIPAAADYSVVDITTAVSQGDAVTVAGAAAVATAASSARVAGMVSATANKVSVLGIIEDCNFESGLTLAAGEAVYLSASSAGKLTNVAPSGSGEVVAELGLIVAVNTAGGGAAAADVLWQPKSIIIV